MKVEKVLKIFKKENTVTPIKRNSISATASSIPTDKTGNFNYDFRILINEYYKIYPYKSTRSCFPVNGRYLSAEDSDKLRKQNIAILFAAIAEVEHKNQFFEIGFCNIQMALHLFSYETKFERYIAFHRKKGVPILVKEEKTDRRMQAIELNYEQYHHLLKKLMELPTITITTYHNFSIDDYLKINSNTWSNFVLPEKEFYTNSLLEVPAFLEETTIEHLLAPERFRAFYQQKEYIISFPITDIAFRDYVINLSRENGEDFLVDLRDVDDIQRENFFIEVGGNLFGVDAVGTNSVIVEPRSGNYSSFGFKYLDPRSGMGPGWEVDVALIDAVKYKRESIYNGILNFLK